jgi:signal transduction histidine kinase
MFYSDTILAVVKFTKKGSVTIKCKPYEEPKGLRSRTETVVEVEVSDTGCGIPSEKLETLFREFEQVDIEEAKPRSSSGLGT